MKMSNKIRKHYYPNDGILGFSITFFGLLLLFFKLVGFDVVLGYLSIFAIIFWPITIILVFASTVLIMMFVYVSVIAIQDMFDKGKYTRGK